MIPAILFANFFTMHEVSSTMTKQLILATTFLLSSFQVGLSQTPQWLDHPTTTGFDEQTCVAASPSFVVYGGTFNADFEGLSTRGLDDCFLRALDPSGVDLWTKRFGSNFSDQLTAVEIAPNGDILAAGLFWIDADFDTTSVVVGSTSSSALFVSRWNAAGDILWVQVIDGSDFKTVSGITHLANGNIVVAGVYLGDLQAGTVSTAATTFDTPYVMALDASGIPLWAIALQSTATNADVNDLCSDQNGLITVCGTFNLGSLKLAADSVGTIGASLDAFVFQVDASGAGQWLISGSNVRDNIAIGLEVDQQNTIHLAGHFSGVLDLGGRSLTSATTSDDLFLAKLTPTGQVLDLRQLGGTSIDDVETLTSLDLEEDRLVLGGFYSGQVNFDGISLEDQGSNTAGFYAVFDTTQQIRIAQNTVGSGFQRVQSLALADGDICYIGVEFSDTYEAQAAGSAISNSNPDVALIKYSEISTEASPVQSAQLFSIFPSVVDDRFTSAISFADGSLRCIDKRGAAVPIDLLDEYSCSVRHLPTGNYALQFTSAEGKKYVSRFTVVR